MTGTLAYELFASGDWAEVLERAYDFSVLRSAGGLPYVALDDLAGRRISALPFVDYLPIDELTVLEAFREEIEEGHPNSPFVVKTRLPAEDLPEWATVTRTAVNHRLFPDGKEDTKFRRGIRIATENGLSVERATGKEALDNFLDMQHRQRQDKFGIISQPPSFFRAIHEVFVQRDRGFYLEARTATGAHAATLVILRCGSGWFYKFGTSTPDHLGSYPNNLLIKHLVDALQEGEAEFLDMGLSGASAAYAGLRRFKNSTGATSGPIHYLTTRSPLVDDRSRQFKSFLGGLTDTLVEVKADREVVEPISERIYRYFA